MNVTNERRLEKARANPSDSEIVEKFFKYAHEQYAQEVVEFFLTHQSAIPQTEAILNYLSGALISLGRHAHAFKVTKQLLRVSQRNGTTANWIGEIVGANSLILYGTPKQERALEFAFECDKEFPNNTDVLCCISMLLHRKGKEFTKESLEYSRRAAASGADSFDSQNWAAHMHLTFGKLAEGHAYAVKAQSLAKGRVQRLSSLKNLARANLSAGRYEEAKINLFKASDISEDQDVLLILGEYYRSVGREDAARTVERKADPTGELFGDEDDDYDDDWDDF